MQQTSDFENDETDAGEEKQLDVDDEAATKVQYFLSCNRNKQTIKTAKEELLKCLMENDIPSLIYEKQCYRHVKRKQPVKLWDALKSTLLDSFDFDEDQFDDFRRKFKIKRAEMMVEQPEKDHLQVKKVKEEKKKRKKEENDDGEEEKEKPKPKKRKTGGASASADAAAAAAAAAAAVENVASTAATTTTVEGEDLEGEPIELTT
jgi:hypothetical protein